MMMQKSTPGMLLITLAVLMVAGVFVGFDKKTHADQQGAVQGKGFAVVELFTSEGCSSCPSADALVSKLYSENQQDVFILGFHVDYWNRLGWKDPFSQAAFSDRQRMYARYLSLDGVYTPQIVVNGTDQFVGSDELHLRAALANGVKQPSGLTIEATRQGTVIHLSYTMKEQQPALLNIAFIQHEATTEIKKGENSGKTLHHVNIVRELKTVNASLHGGSLDIVVPEALRATSFALIVYVQQKDSFTITGAAKAEIRSSI